jgi:predicted Rossmann fold flavoprotein
VTDRPIVVIGAGAAGTMAAIHAARGSRPVVLLEGTRDGGRKILISGGGRCNILPGVADPARFVTDSPVPLVRHILRGWPLPAQREFFERELGLPLVLEPETGKLFPVANRARVVRDALVSAARDRGVNLRFGVTVTGLAPPVDAGGWRVLLDGAPPLEACRVILATGGLSVPTTGSDGAGLRWLAALGHRIHPTYPALTPLTGDAPAHQSLAGISLVTRITARGGGPPRRTEGGFLFTHRGWSGPAVLDISHLAVRSRLSGGPPQALWVQWTDAGTPEWEARLQAGSGQVASLVRQALPERLGALLLSEAGIAPATRLSQLRREDRRRLVAALAEYPLPWSGDEGYRKAEVTGGGLALDEVHSHSLESRRNTGLHVCGEALDAFGPIGGHNFLWAWATGRQAGAAAAAQSVV